MGIKFTESLLAVLPYLPLVLGHLNSLPYLSKNLKKKSILLPVDVSNIVLDE